MLYDVVSKIHGENSSQKEEFYCGSRCQKVMIVICRGGKGLLKTTLLQLRSSCSKDEPVGDGTDSTHDRDTPKGVSYCPTYLST